MWNVNLAVMLTILTISLNLAFQISAPHHSVFGQQDNTTESLILNNNISTGTSSNTTRIMENTSGMIDDAFEALKDSFGSFFGK